MDSRIRRWFKRLPCLFLLLVFESSAIGSALDNQGAPAVWMTVRILPGAKPETLRYLARVAQPTVLRVKAGSDLKKIIREKYGWFNDDIWMIFRSRNPNVTSTSVEADGEVKLPVAPIWFFKYASRIPPDSSVLEHALVQIGAAGPKTLKDIAVANNKSPSALDTTMPEDGILLPYATRSVSFRLENEFALDPSGVADHLRSDKNVIHVQIDPSLNLVPGIDKAELASSSFGCGQLEVGANWPFDTLKLRQVMEAEQLASNHFDQVSVAVLDSGIAEGETRFSLWKNLLEAIGQEGVDDDDNRYTDDIFGADVLARGYYPTANIGSPDIQSHGSHVAGLILGGNLTEPLSAEIRKRIRLIVLKVLREVAGIPEVAQDGLSNAVLYSAVKRASIINISIEGPYSDIVDNALHIDKNILFVVAAGNGRNYEGLDLDIVDVFPAKFGGVASKNVISVAAHDPSGSLACFSNFGKTSVDLAAPGVEVESMLPNARFGKYSGTSQAAALVSFASALLMSEGVSEPSLIKQRLIVSADFVPELRGKIIAEGRLNIPKALAVDYDVVETKQGELILGQLTEPSSLMINGEAWPISQIKNILFNYSDDADKSMRVTVLRHGKIEHNLCSPEIGKIIIRTEAQSRELSRDDVVNIIPALRKRN